MSKITTALEEVGQWDKKSFTQKVEGIADEIEEKLAKLDRLAHEIHKKRDFGTSLYKLYTNSSLDGDYFRDLMADRSLSERIDYNQLESLIKELDVLREGITYDTQGGILAKRRNFDTVGEIQLRGIVKDIEELNRLTDRENITRIREDIGRIDLDSHEILGSKIDGKLLKKSGELLEDILSYEKAFFLSLKKFTLRKKIKAMEFGNTLDEKKDVLKRHKEADEELDTLRVAIGKGDLRKTIDLIDNSRYLNTDFYKNEVVEAKRSIQSIGKLLEGLDKYFPQDSFKDIFHGGEELNLERLKVSLEEEFTQIKKL